METFKQLGKDNAKKKTHKLKTQNGSCRKRYQSLGDIKTQAQEQKLKIRTIILRDFKWRDSVSKMKMTLHQDTNQDFFPISF